MRAPMLRELESKQGLYEYLTQLHRHIGELERRLAQPAGGSPSIVQPRPVATVNVDMAAVRQALQADGEYPLDLTGLTGETITPQIVKAMVFTALPDASDYPVGTLAILDAATDKLYYIAEGLPKAWTELVVGGTNFITTNTNEVIAAGVVKTWTAQQIFTGGLTSAAGLTVTAGQFDSASQFSCGLYQTVPTAMATGAYTPINFDGEFWDNGGCHDNVNPNRITIPAGGDGIWLFGCTLGFAASAAGTVRGVLIQNNAAAVLGGEQTAPIALPNIALLSAVALVNAAAGTWYEILGGHDVGAAHNSVAGFTFFYGYKLC